VRAWRRERQLDVEAVDAGRRLDAAALAGVDVVVLGRSSARVGVDGDAVQTLAGFVERGGGLLLLGPGPRLGGALDGLDPLVADGPPASLDLSGVGTGIPGLLPRDARLPVRAASGAMVKAQAHLLLGDHDRPLIAIRRHGAGWVCSVNLEGIWSWEAASHGHDAGGRFWRLLLRAITPVPSGDLRAERLRLGVGEDLVVWVRPEGARQPLRLVHPDGSVRELVVEDDAARARLEQPGLHHLERGEERLTVVATREVREQAQAARDDARLMRLAAATGGEFADAGDAERLITRLRAMQALAGMATRPEPLIIEPLWFIVALLLAGLEWLLRRRRGLV
jgi:hypothetical protein